MVCNGAIMIVTDLEKVDPRGRCDVLLYRGLEKVTKKLEEKYGIKGVWDTLQPHINSAVVKGLAGFEIPIEATILLGILQANMPAKEQAK